MFLPKKVKKSFALKILMLILVISCVPYFISIVVGIKVVKNHLFEQNQVSLQAFSSIKKKQLINLFDKKFDAIKYIDDRKEIYTFATMNNDDKKKSLLAKHLKNFLTVNNFESLYIFNDSYKIVHSSEHNVSVKTNEIYNTYYNPPFISLLKKSNIDNKTRISDMNIGYANKHFPLLYIVAPLLNIKDLNSEKFFMVFSMKADEINELMVDSSFIGETGETYLVGTDKLMRSNSRFATENPILMKKIQSDEYKLSRIIDTVSGIESHYGVLQDYRDKTVYSFQESLGLQEHFNTDFDWKIYSDIDTAEALSFIYQLRTYFILFGIVLFVLLIMFSKYFSALITKPIIHLTNIAGQMTSGEVPGEIAVTSIDEVGSLAVSFRRLRRRMFQITTAAISISNGDYETVLKPKSKNDNLINSLNFMSKSLSDSKVKQTLLVKDIQKHNLEIEQILSCTRPICAISKDMIIEKVNETFCKMFDLELKDIIGKRCYEILDLPICNTNNCIMKQVFKSKRKTTHKMDVNMHSGEITDLFITGVPLKDIDGSIRGVVENISDITESVRVQKEIEERGLEIEAQSWIKTGQNRLTDTLKGDITHEDMANKAIHFISNYLGTEVGVLYLVSESDKNILHLASSYAFTKRKHISNKIAVGEGLVGQAALEKKTFVLTNVPDDYIKISSGLGEVSPHSIVVVPFLFEEDLIGVIEIGSIEELTKAQLDFLKIVKDSIGVVFNSCFSRENTKILLKRTQNQAEELQTQQEELRVSNEELTEQTEELTTTGEKLKQQQDDLQELNTSLEEKTLYLEEQKHEIEEKNKFITKAKKEVETKAKQLAQASKYKSEFLANMSHELRTPLNSLLILSKDLADNQPKNLSTNQVEAASIIYESGKDLLELINDILDLSKVEAGKMSLEINQVELQGLTKSIFNIFQLNAKQKGVEFKLEVSDKLPGEIVSDSQRLSQIMKNLLSNSFKFTHKGSIKIKIATLQEDSYFNDIKLNIDDWFVISVTDTGIGIAKDKQQLIFEAFQQADGTTSRKYGGTGLGLSISKELTHLLGGQLYLESTHGVGTTFRVLLPRQFNEKNVVGNLPQQDQMSDSSYDEPSQAIIEDPLEIDEHIDDDRDNLNENDNLILAIEDDLTFAKVLKKFCNDQGVKMIHAGNGDYGVKLALKYKPIAIMLDIMLPGKDGWQILKEIKQDKQLAHIPIQIMTASEVDLKKVAFPVLGILNKPIQTDKLTALLESIKTDKTHKIAKVIAIDNSDYLKQELLQVSSSKGFNLIHETDLLSITSNQNHSDAMFIIINIDKVKVTYQKLATVLKNENQQIPPIIVFCDNDNLPEPNIAMDKRIKSIIVKGAKATERLLDEFSLTDSIPIKNNPPKVEVKETSVNEAPSMLHDKDEHLEGKRILVVDDDMRNVFAVSHLLESKKMIVTSTMNGKNALEMLKEDNNIDLILMDIMMPIMDGETATKLIRKEDKLKDIPIIVLTAKAMQGDKERFISAGASDYLAKPLDTDKLLSLLRIWLS